MDKGISAVVFMGSADAATEPMAWPAGMCLAVAALCAVSNMAVSWLTGLRVEKAQAQAQAQALFHKAICCVMKVLRLLSLATLASMALY